VAEKVCRFWKSFANRNRTTAVENGERQKEMDASGKGRRIMASQREVYRAISAELLFVVQARKKLMGQEQAHCDIESSRKSGTVYQSVVEGWDKPP